LHKEADDAVETGFVRKRASIAMSALAAVLCSTAAATAGTIGPVVSEFDTGLTSNVSLWGVTAGPDGNMWFTEESNNAVGRITPGAVITEFTAGFPTGSPRGIVTGPDGNLWVAMAGGDGAIARVTKAGVVTEFPVPTVGDPEDIAVGPDRNLWYVDSAADLVGRITPNGSITEFTGLNGGSQPTSITKGPDGAMWMTLKGSGNIGRITTTGVISEFSSSLSGSAEPMDIVTGPDGNLWFTLHANPGAIGRITTKGDVTEFTTGLTRDAKPHGIAAGPDGALWFTEAGKAAIGRITIKGEITEYTTGLSGISAPWQIAAGTDGNMWFTGSNTPGMVGRITLPPLVRDLTADKIEMTSARLRGKVRPNSQATYYRFEYGRTTAYGNETPSEYGGSAYDLSVVMATVEGLEPGTEYHFRAIAENDAGETKGPDRTFTTETLPVNAATDEPTELPAKAPEFAKRVVVEPEGTVRVKTPGGQWEALAAGAELPVGVALDTRRGHVDLSSEGCRGGTQTGTFGGGIFSVRQPRAGCGRVDVYLRGGNFKQCRHRASSPRGRVSASASRKRRVRKLWGRDSGGRFRSHGRHSHATVRGTRWLTIDRCDATVTRVTQGAVAVRDYARHRTVLVRAGHSYTAKPRKARKRHNRRRG
jgi:virginiamycin B lyase